MTDSSASPRERIEQLLGEIHLLGLANSTRDRQRYITAWVEVLRLAKGAEVLAPVQYPYVPNMTVETAVAIAGGFTPRAYRYDFVISRSYTGVTSRQKVPLIALVRPGDTITVGERWF
jgi:polysaccharide biosynthesis/export protein